MDSEESKLLDSKTKSSLLKDFITLVCILISVFIFRSVLFEPFKIPSESMLPTLAVGDYILVKKYEYGFKVPFSDMSFGSINLDPIYLTDIKSPKRGDVIVFKFPNDPTRNYIKRVIGIPGDVIEIKNKVVFINDKELKVHESEIGPFLRDMSSKYKDYNLKAFNVKIGSTKHFMLQDNDNYYKVDHEQLTVPEGKFFVMGDNRDFSNDSRFWGFVPMKNIRGKAIMIWFSMNLPTGNEGFLFRPWRIGNSIL